jgi:hypothetical protein
VLTAVGIVHFRKTGDRVDVSIDTGELREKTEDLIDAVKETLSEEESDDSMSERFDELIDDTRDAIDATEDTGSDLFDHPRRPRR